MEFNFSKPVVKGWHWRTLVLTVAAIAALQVILDLATHRYTVFMTAPLGVLFVGYLVVPRIKERRVANAVAGVTAIFIIDLILQIVLDYHGFPSRPDRAAFYEDNLMSLVLGLLVCFGYTKLTDWSDRKRIERESKRQVQPAVAKAKQHAEPVRRHHSKKRSKRRK